MNSADTPCFFPPCGSYDPPPPQWGWRQDLGAYPYYSETSLQSLQPLQALSHQTLPPDSSSGVGGGSASGGGGGGGAPCSASSTDCRIGTSQLGGGPGGGGGGGGGYVDSNGRRSVKEEASGEHSNDRDDDVPHSSMKQEATSSDCAGGANKKKRDRFNGMTEEEVLKKTVPDLLAPNLDIIIIGSCPGLTAAYLGHHYAGPGNHFWKCLYLAGLIPEPMNACDDYKLKQFGIGFTNFIARCSKGSVEFSRREIKEGVECLTEKIQAFKPKIAVFNGKGIYEVFCNHKNFYIGKQPEPFPGTNTVVYVMPSSSARCSQLPRASDKVPFFVALRKLRDHLRGCLPHLDESEIVFPDLDLKVEPRKDRRPTDESGRPAGSEMAGAAAAAAAAAEKDRKRRHVDCNYNEMSASERLYRSGLSSSFAVAMSSQEAAAVAQSEAAAAAFKWSGGAGAMQKWGGGLGGLGASGGSSRPDCTYESMLAAKQQDESSRAAAAINQGLLRSFSTGCPPPPFYAPSCWPDPVSHSRWSTAIRFDAGAMSSRYMPPPPYLQYPDMMGGAGHHLDSRAMYSGLYNPAGYHQQSGEVAAAAAAAAAASAFSYNSALQQHHDMKGQLDPAAFLQRPSYSPPSYYPQYR